MQQFSVIAECAQTDRHSKHYFDPLLISKNYCFSIISQLDLMHIGRSFFFELTLQALIVHLTHMLDQNKFNKTSETLRKFYTTIDSYEELLQFLAEPNSHRSSDHGSPH